MFFFIPDYLKTETRKNSHMHIIRLSNKQTKIANILLKKRKITVFYASEKIRIKYVESCTNVEHLNFWWTRKLLKLCIFV